MGNSRRTRPKTVTQARIPTSINFLGMSAADRKNSSSLDHPLANDDSAERPIVVEYHEDKDESAGS